MDFFHKYGGGLVNIRKSFIFVTFTCFMLVFIGQAFSGNRSDDPLGVAVSPQTLILGVDQGGWVSVHTDIPYGSVDLSSLALNGVMVSWTKADSTGNLVGKFKEAAIKAIVTPPEEVMTLTGVSKEGVAFVGSDSVRVIIDPTQ